MLLVFLNLFCFMLNSRVVCLHYCLFCPTEPPEKKQKLLDKLMAIRNKGESKVWSLKHAH